MAVHDTIQLFAPRDEGSASSLALEFEPAPRQRAAKLDCDTQLEQFVHREQQYGPNWRARSGMCPLPLPAEQYPRKVHQRRQR
jgi:hypothetical protein